MGSLFSNSDSGRASWAPPPPTAPSVFAAEQAAEPEESARARQAQARPQASPFFAELDACEVDDRGRPTQVWTGRGRRLSRANIVVASRRMCYCGRELLLAVHLIDATPVGLFGRVTSCEYEGDGLYLIDIDLLPMPDRDDVKAWLRARGRSTLERNEARTANRGT